MQQKQLGVEDARAVDFLLENAAIGSSTMYAEPRKNGFDKRLSSVEAILSVLKEMPAEDPPADLAARTLERIARAPYAPAQIQSLQADQRRHA